MIDLCSISEIKYIQKAFGFRNAKSLGQNFLLDHSVIREMVSAAGITSNDLVIEIGPGIGVLTDEIARHAGRVIAIEVDKALLPVLDYTLSEHNNVKVINDDILKVDVNNLIDDELSTFGNVLKIEPKRENVKIMGNLPYYITTPIITELLENQVHAESITMMVQKEVAERIIAPPGNRTYGALSVAVQYRCSVEKVIDVHRDRFFPEPKVDSEVLKLNILDSPAVSVKDEGLFFRLVKAGFGQRRKTLSNSLLSTGIEKEKILTALETSGVDSTRRAETLSLEEFGKLTDILSES